DILAPTFTILERLQNDGRLLRLHAAQNTAFRSGCFPSIKAEYALTLKPTHSEHHGNITRQLVYSFTHILVYPLNDAPLRFRSPACLFTSAYLCGAAGAAWRRAQRRR